MRVLALVVRDLDFQSHDVADVCQREEEHAGNEEAVPPHESDIATARQ